MDTSTAFDGIVLCNFPLKMASFLENFTVARVQFLNISLPYFV